MIKNTARAASFAAYPRPARIESISNGSTSSTIKSRLTVALALCLVLAAAFMATSTGIAALGSAFGLLRLPHALWLLDVRLPGIFRLHMIASGLGLILLPWTMLLRHNHAAHRIVGRAAAALLIIGVAASLPCALMSTALPAARAGFMTQGLLSLVLLIRAVTAVSRGQMLRHQRAMLRAASLLSGVVLLRLMVSAVTDWPAHFDLAYAVIAWISWLIPLAAIDLWLRRRSDRRCDLTVHRHDGISDRGLNLPGRVPHQLQGSSGRVPFIG